MKPHFVFLMDASKFVKTGGVVPGIRVLTAALETHAAITKHEVEAGRISHADLFSKEIQRYEHSALGSSRII